MEAMAAFRVAVPAAGAAAMRAADEAVMVGTG
jgi:hypothetical protein